MQIQWYPGHMHKAKKEIREILPKVDLIVEILDARIPFSSENPMLAEIRGDKPCIKLLSKTDLADPVITQQWLDYLEQDDNVEAAFPISTKQPEAIRQLPGLIRKRVSFKGEPIQTMVMGIPNVGKSTLINILAGRMIAKTGNEPAITKGQQRIKLENGIILLDTPGVLWPNVENVNSGYRLASSGAIRDTAMEYPDVAFYLSAYMMAYYPQLLLERYELDLLPELEIEFLETIGAKRGCLRAGGQVDLEKISRLFLMEFRMGTLGQISLERPEDKTKELAELIITRADKAQKKAAKEAARKKKKRKKR